MQGFIFFKKRKKKKKTPKKKEKKKKKKKKITLSPQPGLHSGFFSIPGKV